MKTMLTESETKAVKISSARGFQTKLVSRSTGETIYGPCMGPATRGMLFRQWSNQLARS
jgi:hypothetical protein